MGARWSRRRRGSMRPAGGRHWQRAPVAPAPARLGSHAAARRPAAGMAQRLGGSEPDGPSGLTDEAVAQPIRPRRPRSLSGRPRRWIRPRLGTSPRRLPRPARSDAGCRLAPGWRADRAGSAACPPASRAPRGVVPVAATGAYGARVRRRRPMGRRLRGAEGTGRDGGAGGGGRASLRDGCGWSGSRRSTVSCHAASQRPTAGFPRGGRHAAPCG
jgi:hypothetical protein